MANILIEHRWKEQRKDEVFKVVNSIIEMAKNGKLPAGFQLKKIDLISGESKAICEWEAPGIHEMSELLEKVNPRQNILWLNSRGFTDGTWPLL